MKTLLKLTIACMLAASAAQAQSFTDQVAAKYRDMDFGFVEIKSGPSQVKVEAVKDATKYEVVYDAATGRILKQETETATLAERARRGVAIDTEDRDFLRSARAEEEDDRGRGRGRGRDDVDDDDDDEDDSGRGRGRDDASDDDGDDDHGSGRDRDDDGDNGNDDGDRSGRGGGDDRGGDDRGGDRDDDDSDDD